MGNPKVTLSGRVDPEIREWIEREADKRDRTKSYVFEEKLQKAKRYEEALDDRKKVPA